jgi:prepilin-type processing-associated H-X9-DG protein
MLKKMIVFICLVVCTGRCDGAADQNVLRYVDDLTYGVIRLDVKALDLSSSVDALLAVAGKTLEVNQAEHLKKAVGRSQKIIETDLGTFRDAGGREIYAIFNLQDIPAFFLVCPVDRGVDQAQLKAAIETVARKSFKIRDLVIESQGRLVLAGRRRSLEAAMTPPTTALWSTLLDKKPIRPLRIVVVPNEMQLRVLKEMWPQATGVPGLDQLKTLVQNCEWLTLSVQVVPDMAFEVALEMQTKEAADQVVAFWKVMSSLMAEASRIDPTMFKQIDVAAQGRQVTWSIDHRQTQSILGKLLLGPLQHTVLVSERMACGTNVSGMGKAILIYANDYNDQLPPNLNILIEKVEMTEKGLTCPGAGHRDSYGYCGDGLDFSCEPTLMIAYDKKGNHAEPGRNVLFLDSHVEWITEARFQELTVQVNAVRKERGLKAHVFE